MAWLSSRQVDPNDGTSILALSISSSPGSMEVVGGEKCRRVVGTASIAQVDSRG